MKRASRTGFWSRSRSGSLFSENRWRQLVIEPEVGDCWKVFQIRTEAAVVGTKIRDVMDVRGPKGQAPPSAFLQGSDDTYVAQPFRAHVACGGQMVLPRVLHRKELGKFPP